MTEIGGGPPKSTGDKAGDASLESPARPLGTRVTLDIRIEGVTGDMLRKTLLEILSDGGPGGGGEAGSTEGPGG